MPPDLLSGSSPRTSRTLKRTPPSPLPCPVRVPQMPPPSDGDPYQPPMPVGSRSRASQLLIPDPARRLPFALRGQGRAGRLTLQGVPSPPVVATWPGAVAWTLSCLSVQRYGPSREERRICMRPAARQRRPRPRRAERGPGWAGLSRAARSRLAPPQAEPPSPAPSVSLPCSRRGRSDLQRSRGARSNRLGASPPGPGNGGWRGRSPPCWAPRHCQVRACTGARGRGSAGAQQGARSLRVSSERCAPRLGTHCRLPSPALYLSPFSRTSCPLLPIFLSLSVSSSCRFSACWPSLPLPSVSPSLFSPCCLVFPHLQLLFAFFFLYLSLFLFPLSFSSSVLSSPLFPSSYPISHSSIPFLLFVPPPSLVPGFPPSSLFPPEGKDCQVCVCSWGGGVQLQLPAGSPTPAAPVAQEEREETVVRRVLSSTLPLSPS